LVENIIYYDGECGLCHMAVKFILKVDSKNKFYFSPLSNFDNNLKNIDSIILKSGDKVFYESQAIIMVFENIDNNWNYLAKVLKIFPINVLDIAYRWVSRNRTKISVKEVSSCPIVPSYYRKRFISK
jgi:predicted DCC family thiol-disulfide oxidoreductase YuxK